MARPTARVKHYVGCEARRPLRAVTLPKQSPPAPAEPERSESRRQNDGREGAQRGLSTITIWRFSIFGICSTLVC
ncbi:hypothetical protein AcidC75_05060 [Acidisoma sp. C75]